VTDLLDAPARQASSLQATEHRPWELPSTPWVMGQTWDDLLFAHWQIDVEALRAHVPEPLAIDEHGGTAWLGVTPFVVSGVRARGTLPLPLVSSFRELNVRTYVTHEGKPGIWFFSLDASSSVAVAAARRLYRLPYFNARITIERRSGRLLYECVRDEGKAFSGSYRGLGSPTPPEVGTLEHFLTERYCLYTQYGGTLYRADIHHRPWPLERADAAIDLNTMPPEGLDVSGSPLVHYSRRQDVVIWPLSEVTSAASVR
jgi:uncharacterized protein